MTKLQFSLAVGWSGWFFRAGDWQSRKYATKEEALEYKSEELLVLAVKLCCSGSDGPNILIETGDLWGSHCIEVEDG